MTTITTLKLERKNLKNELYHKNIIMNDSTEKRNAFQANKECLLPFSNTKYRKNKNKEEKAIELIDRRRTGRRISDCRARK